MRRSLILLAIALSPLPVAAQFQSVRVQVIDRTLHRLWTGACGSYRLGGTLLLRQLEGDETCIGD
jgi:hypothetical protein